MIAALEKEPVDKNQYRNQTISEGDDIDIASLVSKETLRFFNILVGNDRDLTFLKKPQNQWKDDLVYEEIFQIVNNLIVVNDPAERAVALITNFNNAITTRSNIFCKMLNFAGKTCLIGTRKQ